MENSELFGGLLLAAAVATCALAIIAVSVWVWWRIVSRTGHSGWLSLLMLVPLANIVLLLMLAFGEWPIHREMADLRRRLETA